jgi:uncharacterized LabA/DUF88 family protein
MMAQLLQQKPNSPMSQSQSIAYIDGANLHTGICSLGWALDYKRFRSWLRQKYGVKTAYIFIGKISRYESLYTSLEAAGYTLIFKEVVVDPSGKVKGNCDADLVLKAAREHFESNVNRVVLVSNDGDYAALVQFWLEKNVGCTILSPSVQNRSSLLLRRTGAPIVYLHDVRNKICSW